MHEKHQHLFFFTELGIVTFDRLLPENANCPIDITRKETSLYTTESGMSKVPVLSLDIVVSSTVLSLKDTTL